MSVLIELFEATGPAKTSELVYNMNWKNVSAVDSSYKYWTFPINRPIDDVDDELYVCSYVKYVYAKISGTYSKVKRVRWSVNGTPGNFSRLYYNMTNSYTNPNVNLMSNGVLINSPVVIVPCLSTVSPESATTRITTLSPNTTYYTNYFTTQLYVQRKNYNNVGNTQPINFYLSLDDYE